MDRFDEWLHLKKYEDLWSEIADRAMHRAEQAKPTSRPRFTDRLFSFMGDRWHYTSVIARGVGLSNTATLERLEESRRQGLVECRKRQGRHTFREWRRI